MVSMNDEQRQAFRDIVDQKIDESLARFEKVERMTLDEKTKPMQDAFARILDEKTKPMQEAIDKHVAALNEWEGGIEYRRPAPAVTRADLDAFVEDIRRVVREELDRKP
jgi:hypothetical protein